MAGSSGRELGNPVAEIDGLDVDKQITSWPTDININGIVTYSRVLLTPALRK
jgi:hypothetical protein